MFDTVATNKNPFLKQHSKALNGFYSHTRRAELDFEYMYYQLH